MAEQSSQISFMEEVLGLLDSNGEDGGAEDPLFPGSDEALDLFISGLYSCGTLRTNRKGFPVALKSASKRGVNKRGKGKTDSRVF